MRTTTTIRSYSAIAAGTFFATVTCFVLFEDVVRHSQPVTVKHVMTLAVLFGTLFFGHRFWPELRAWRFGTAGGCALLFLAGTAYCVITSAGRNAEAGSTKVLLANSVNTARQSAQKDRDEAKARYEAALAAETAECGSGDGLKCQGKRITRKLRREDYDTAELALRAQQPEQVANPDMVAAARMLATLPGVSAEPAVIEQRLLMLFPFLAAMFCEIATIVGFSIGLAHRAATVSSPHKRGGRGGEGRSLRRWTKLAPHPTPLPMNDGDRVRVAGKQLLATEEEIVRAALEFAGRPVSNDELAFLLGVTKGEASKRVSALSHSVVRERRGREVAISLREA